MKKKNPAAAQLGRLGGFARARLPVDELRVLNSRAGKARWENMSPEQQRVHVAKMTRGRAKAQRKRTKKARKRGK